MKRRTSPPEDFSPTQKHTAYASVHGLSLYTERDHWLEWCQAYGRTYCDINAGFSTWLRQAVNFGRGNKPRDPSEPRRYTERPLWSCVKGNPECVDGYVDTPAGALSCECRGQTLTRSI